MGRVPYVAASFGRLTIDRRGDTSVVPSLRRDRAAAVPYRLAALAEMAPKGAPMRACGAPRLQRLSPPLRGEVGAVSNTAPSRRILGANTLKRDRLGMICSRQCFIYSREGFP